MTTEQKYDKKTYDALVADAIDYDEFDAQQSGKRLALGRETFAGFMDRIATMATHLAAWRTASEAFSDDDGLPKVARALALAVKADSDIEEMPTVLKSLTSTAGKTEPRILTLLAHGPDNRKAYELACGEHTDGEDFTPAVSPTLAGFQGWISLKLGVARRKSDEYHPPVFDKNGRRFDERIPVADLLDKGDLKRKLAEAAADLPETFLPGEYSWEELRAIGRYIGQLIVAHHDAKIDKKQLIEDDNSAVGQVFTDIDA